MYNTTILKDDLIKLYIYNSILSSYNIKYNNKLSSNISIISNIKIITELKKIDNFFIKLNDIYNNILISDIFIGNDYNSTNIILYNDNLLYYYINKLLNIYNSRIILCISNNDLLYKSIKYYNNNIIIHKNIPKSFYDYIIIHLNNIFDINNYINNEKKLSNRLKYYYNMIYYIRLNGHLIIYLNQTILTNYSLIILYYISIYFKHMTILTSHNKEISNSRFNLILIFKNKINIKNDYNYNDFKNIIKYYYNKLIYNYFYSINNITYHRYRSKNINLITSSYYKNIYLSQLLSCYFFNNNNINYDLLYKSIKLIYYSIKDELYDINKLKYLDKNIYNYHIIQINFNNKYLIINNNIRRYYDLIDEYVYNYINKTLNIKINKIWLHYNNIIKYFNILENYKNRLNIYYLGEDIDIIDNCIRYNIFKSKIYINYKRYEYINYSKYNIIGSDIYNIKLYNYLCKNIDIMICNINNNEKEIIKNIIFIIYNLRLDGICIIKYNNYNNKIINQLYNILFNQFNKIIIYRPKQNIYDNKIYIICLNYKNILSDIIKNNILEILENKREIIIDIEIINYINYINNDINIRYINNIRDQLYHISNWYNIDIGIKKKLRKLLIKNKILNILKNI